ncbi:MAG TPA: LamG domain-containing protein [Kofleriaceae bacterium]
MRGLAVLLVLVGCDEAFDLEHIEDVPLPQGLVAYFPMDDIAGGVLVDLAGSHDGACATCPSRVSGVRGNAMQFDGATMLVTAPSSPVLEANASFSIAVWVRLDGPTFADDYGCTVNKRFGTELSNSWQFCTFMDRWYFFTGTDQIVGPTIDYGTWHHLAATLDAATSQLQLYQDGVPFRAPVTQSIPLDDGPLIIGADIDSGTTASWLPGTLDEFRIYDRALAHSEILDLIRAQ